MPPVLRIVATWLLVQAMCMLFRWPDVLLTGSPLAFEGMVALCAATGLATHAGVQLFRLREEGRTSALLYLLAATLLVVAAAVVKPHGPASLAWDLLPDVGFLALLATPVARRACRHPERVRSTLR